MRNIEIISQNGDEQTSNVVVTKPLCSLQDSEGNIIAQDYIDYSKGVVHRECGYIVLDGNTNISYMDTSNNTARFMVALNNVKSITTYKCDKLKVLKQSEAGDEECVIIRDLSSDNIVNIRVKKDRLSEVSTAGIKNYLSSAPISIIYELATPIEEPIDCSNKIVQYSTQTTVSNRDGAEIEVSLTNNEAIAEVNGEFKNNEIQTITNENGTAIKFPNGMSICSFFGERATGSTYGDVIWNYPMPFKEAPVVLGLAGQGENYAVLQMMLNSPGTNMAVVQFLQNNSYYVSKKAKFSIVAIGRWK